MFCLDSRVRPYVSVTAVYLGSRVRPCGYGAAFCLDSRVRPCVSVGAVCPRFAHDLAILAGRFALGSRVGLVALAERCPRFACSALRFYRGVLPRFAPGLAILAGGLSSVHARHCGSGAAFCHRFVPDLCNSIVAFYPSLRVRPCGYGAAFCLDSRVRPCVSVGAVCPRFARWACNSGGALCLGSRVRPCGYGAAFCPRFARWACNSGGRFVLGSCVRPCVSVGAICPRFASGLAVMAQRFAIGLCPTFAILFYCSVLPQFAHDLAILAGGLSSVHARHCGSVAAFFSRFTLGIAILSPRFAIGLRAAMRFCCGSLPQFTPVFFPLSGKKKRLAVSYVPVPPGRDRHSCVLAVSARLSGAVGSLRVWPFICGDLDGVTGDAGNGERGTGLRGLTARPLYIFAQPHWPCGSFRGEYAGAARPRLRQRVFDSLDSPHAAAGLCWCVYAPSPGYTERPDRL